MSLLLVIAPWDIDTQSSSSHVVVTELMTNQKPDYVVAFAAKEALTQNLQQAAELFVGIKRLGVTTVVIYPYADYLVQQMLDRLELSCTRLATNQPQQLLQLILEQFSRSGSIDY